MDECNPRGEKSYWGKYRGEIADRKDPKELGRVKIRCPEVTGEIISDWAPIETPFGGIHDVGTIAIPPLGATVFIMYEAGDVNRPLVTGTWWGEPDGFAETPKHARGLDDETDETKGKVLTSTIEFWDPEKELESEPRPDPLEVQEPPSPAAGTYPDVIVFKSASGHMTEFDDTEGEERIHVFHRIGSYKEMRRDGSVVEKSIKKKHEIVGEDHILQILGKQFVLVEQPAQFTYRQSKTEVVAGDKMEEVQGKKIAVVRGDHDAYFNGRTRMAFGGKVELAASGEREDNVGGSYDMTVGSAFTKSVSQIKSEMIANQYFDSVAKSLDIVFGDYEITLTAGNETHTLTLGDFMVQVVAGKIDMQTLAGNVIVKTAVGNATFEATTGIATLKGLTQALMEATGGTASVKSTAGTTVDSTAGPTTVKSGTQVDVQAPLINLGMTAAQGVVLANLLTIYNLHMHQYSPGPGAAAPTGPPLPPNLAIPGTHSSLTVKAQV